MTDEPYDLSRLRLARKVQRLWESSSDDLGSACREFDYLVAEHGRFRMARALSDAHLAQSGAQGTSERKSLPAARQRGTSVD